MSKKVSGWPLIVPKEVDTSITGDQVLEALAADVEAGDNGKVLTAIYGGLEGEETGSVEWSRVDRLPVIGSGDAGKVLTVNAGETGAEWDDPAEELPTIAAGDAGKVLTVNAGATGAEWAEPSGGLSYFDLLPLRVHVITEGLFGVLKSEFDAISNQAPVMFVFQSDGDTPNSATSLAICSTFFRDTGAFDIEYATYTTDPEEQYLISATKYDDGDPEIYISIGNATMTLTVDADHPTYYTGALTQN